MQRVGVRMYSALVAEAAEDLVHMSERHCVLRVYVRDTVRSPTCPRVQFRLQLRRKEEYGVEGLRLNCLRVWLDARITRGDYALASRTKHPLANYVFRPRYERIEANGPCEAVLIFSPAP